MAYEYAPALIHAGKKNRDMKDVYLGQKEAPSGISVPQLEQYILFTLKAFKSQHFLDKTRLYHSIHHLRTGGSKNTVSVGFNICYNCSKSCCFCLSKHISVGSNYFDIYFAFLPFFIDFKVAEGCTCKILRSGT